MSSTMYHQHTHPPHLHYIVTILYRNIITMNCQENEKNALSNYDPTIHTAVRKFHTTATLYW
jgi:hypothetical protein